MKNLAFTIALGSALSGLLGACAPAHVAVQTPYDPNQYLSYRSEGANAIKGQAFLIKRGGGVVTCAGRPIFLAPDSPYFREIATIAVSGSKPDFPHARGGPEDVIRHTTCDAQGNFGFANLPDGNYILMAEVRWMVGDATQGGPMWMPRGLSGGVQKRVIMSNSLFDANRASH